MYNCLILGSGRSGTSMAAGVLAKSGYFMGRNLIPPRPANPKGFFESEQITDVKKRLDFSSTVLDKTVEGEIARAKWKKAIASISDEKICPLYKGMKIKPQEGLIPIGRNQDSGLWEFAHLQTGELPQPESDGKFKMTEDTGLVFVLIPAGTFRMGAVSPSNSNPSSVPNVDPAAEKDEKPVHEVSLDAFFLSKLV